MKKRSPVPFWELPDKVPMLSFSAINLNNIKFKKENYIPPFKASALIAIGLRVWQRYNMNMMTTFNPSWNFENVIKD